jgi:hypothetical protein
MNESINPRMNKANEHDRQLAEENASLKREVAALRSEKRANRRETLRTTLQSPSMGLPTVPEAPGMYFQILSMHADDMLC